MGIFKQIANKKALLSAFEKIIRKEGYYSKGYNSDILTKVDTKYFEDLASLLVTGKYNPKPSRRVYIIKPDGCKRPLGISCSIDKIIQSAIKEILEPILEKYFLDVSHGFRPKRSCHTAIRDVKLKFSSVS
jgi:retron-type reverse transcriptase